MKRRRNSPLTEWWLELGTGLLLVAGLVGIYWMLSLTPIHQYRYPH